MQWRLNFVLPEFSFLIHARHFHETEFLCGYACLIKSRFKWLEDIKTQILILLKFSK